MEKTYPYKFKLSYYLIAIPFLAGMTYFFCTQAMTNNRGLIINKLIYLSPSNATGFYWLFTGMGIFSFVMTIYILILNLTSRRQIALNEKQITVPKALSNSNVIVPYQSIWELRISSVNNERFLTITYVGGKIHIAESWLPDETSFDELWEVVSGKVR